MKNEGMDKGRAWPKKARHFLYELAFYTTLGAFIGAYIGLYQYVISFLGKISTALYHQTGFWWIFGTFALMSMLGVISYFLVRLDRNIDGSGVPNILISLRKDEPIDYKKGMWTVPLSSGIAIFSRMSLGSEGPSVALGAKSTVLLNDVYHREHKDEDIAMGAAIGFGTAFLSPLAGFVHYLETTPGAWKKPLNILKAIYLALLAYLFADLVSPTHLLSLEAVPIITIGFVLSSFLLFLFNLPLSYLYLKGLCLTKRFFALHEEKGILRYRGLLYFPLVCFLNYYCFDLLGNGHALMDLDYLSLPLYGLFLALLLRSLFIFLFGTGKVSGGLVLPTMSIGILSAEILLSLLVPMGFLKVEEASLYMMLSMTMVFSFVNKAPWTGAFLFLSVMLDSNEGFPSILLFILAILFFQLGSKALSLMKGNGLYARFIEIAEEKEALLEGASH